jgi:hypothetical protein
MNEKRDQLIVECHQLGLGHAEIAADFGITRERVRQIVKRELGASTPLPLTTTAKRERAIKALLAIEAGNTVEGVAMDEELSNRGLSAVLRRAGVDIRRLAFEAWMSQQLGRQFNCWQVLSMRPQAHGSTSRARCRVTAKCLKCEAVCDVGYRSIEIGASRMCHSCGVKNRRNGVPVLDTQTSTIFASFAAASRSSGFSYQRLLAPSRSGEVNEVRFQRLAPAKRRALQGRVHRHPVL